MIDRDVIIVVLIFLLFGFALFHFGYLSFGDGNDNGTTTTTIQNETCEGGDLYEEFRNEFGYTVMWETENFCENNFADVPAGLSGQYYDEEDIVGCLYNPALPDVCALAEAADSEEFEIAEEFCEDDLLGEWICDDEIAFFGCICQSNIPVWHPPDNIPPDEYCQLRGGGGILALEPQFCSGDCEDGLTCLTFVQGDNIICYCGEQLNHT